MKVELKPDHSPPVHCEPLVLRALLRVTGDPVEGRPHSPMQLAMVLDRSGSMAGAKLHYVREAAALVLRQLWAADAVLVATYDREVGILASNAVGPDAHAAAGKFRDASHVFHTLDDSPAAGREARDLDLMAQRVEEHAGFDAFDLKYMKHHAWDSRRFREAGKKRYSR